MSLSVDELADCLVARLVERQDADIKLDAFGIVAAKGMTQRELSWSLANPDPMRGALVRAKRYTPGTLDKIYQLEGSK